ncbi:MULTISPECIES: sigma-70 family RNA polymerase sigma factor [Streptomyces]|uniref:Sigma-70 family RNA polymerase sigma factor n=1 Tax=Streptomyces glycanivorans TaxID=3033808 RepID=A0ABY9JB20_9ACTN|nr:MULTISPECIES: sigma-70 family RNA polymerase sigma factor [unclassified Streptomyces]WSQ78368.1 sigma-70 family RNA polymerase sigma factor [Streptomyces sp. NBC_01213]WLQ64986.1 sigma-70 family RNA polymerase sigma factor [Streptomyces sp. Alt3]WSQ85742.1 sigma-70 family RNA polymerase sigma factor [Streptomyces sp. NBC_01212]WSR08166.1 sigma-70 family RNA polymerase sigma factor [Streptomyces sp. NBC_01208]WSR49085.1 sigma-70 family RNA polymerase sigma factor [Streptomyces sp. NBC_01201]
MHSVDRGEDVRQQPDLDQLMVSAAEGNRDAFAGVYDTVAGPVMGMVRKVLRDSAQSEEVMQDVLLEVWRTCERFRPDRGSAMAWIMTLAHRRAVDRVRASQASQDREHRAAALSSDTPFDEVSEQVETRMEWQRVRHCVRTLTDIQRESVVLAYYGGFTYKEIAHSLSLPLGTVKTRLRDGMIRLRDCLGAKP